jgi:hypothetical protein
MSSQLNDPKTSSQFPADYFDKLYAFLNDGGTESVVKWLSKRPLDHARLRAAPPLSRGKKEIIESAIQVRRTPIDDIFERYVQEKTSGIRPGVIFHRDLTAFVLASDFFDDTARLIGLLNAKNFHFKMAERGYTMFKNPNDSEWRRGKYRTRIAFLEKDVPVEERYAMVEAALADRAKDA